MIKKVIYIAKDGTEFENKKKDCEQYETRYNAILDNPKVFFDYLSSTDKSTVRR